MFAFNMFPRDQPHNFAMDYRCFSVSMMPGNDRQDVERGGKIILPPSALETLTRLHIQYPMLFKLTNTRANRVTHCGVLEFVADEGQIFLPYWMMTNLLLEEGSILHVENLSLPVATFAKFEPQSPDFLDITNPKAVLENALRKFACLTTGDMIAINYNDKIYELKVLETKPANAVSIIECDMNVDFAPPIGYKEPEYKPKTTDEDEPMSIDANDYANSSKFKVFGGQGNRLDGKNKPLPLEADTSKPVEIKRGIPNYDYQKWKITFIRSVRLPAAPATVAQDKENKDSSLFSAFSGEGHSLRTKHSQSSKKK